MSVITAITAAGPTQRARRLVFSDGSDGVVLPKCVLKELGLNEGDEVDLATLSDERADLEPAAARDRALQLLNYRERSVAELGRRLHEDGYLPSIVRSTVDRMQELGLVDDERFASLYARSRVAAGYGPRRIARELREKGVSEDIATRAIDACSEESELDRAVDALRGKRPADAKDRDRLMRRLVSRGFSLNTARDAVGRASSDDDELS